MSSEDPVERIATGATKGVLDWTQTRIKELAFKFTNRDVAFIEDKETIDLVKTQRKSTEWGHMRNMCEIVICDY